MGGLPGHSRIDADMIPVILHPLLVEQVSDGPLRYPVGFLASSHEGIPHGMEEGEGFLHLLRRRGHNAQANTSGRRPPEVIIQYLETVRYRLTVLEIGCGLR